MGFAIGYLVDWLWRYAKLWKLRHLAKHWRYTRDVDRHMHIEPGFTWDMRDPQDPTRGAWFSATGDRREQALWRAIKIRRARESQQRPSEPPESIP